MCHNLGTVPAVTGSFLTSGLVVFVLEPLQVVLALAELARFLATLFTRLDGEGVCGGPTTLVLS